MLREKVPHAKWEIRDSEYEGFYVRGLTQEGILIKITAEDAPGEFYLGIYTYQAHPSLDPLRRQTLVQELEQQILQAFEGEGGSSGE